MASEADAVPAAVTATAAGDGELFCTCQQPYQAGVFMISCDSCEEWFHGTCVGVVEAEAADYEVFHCPACEPLLGSSRRKSTHLRPRPKRIRYDAAPWPEDVSMLLFAGVHVQVRRCAYECILPLMWACACAHVRARCRVPLCASSAYNRAPRRPRTGIPSLTMRDRVMMRPPFRPSITSAALLLASSRPSPSTLTVRPRPPGALISRRWLHLGSRTPCMSSTGTTFPGFACHPGTRFRLVTWCRS